MERAKVARADAATVRRIRGMLAELLEVRRQWSGEKRSGTLDPPDSELHSLRQRIDTLASPK